MNELLQKHGCSNVFTIPEGLRELMSDISREVLREQPSKICDFITNYLSALLVTREHGLMAVKILEDLCDCKPTVSEHLLQLGFENPEADKLATMIKTEIGEFEPVEKKEKIKEAELLKRILDSVPLDEDMSVKVCQVARNAYREYWYRKKLLEQGLKDQPDEPWEIAAQHTLELYKRTKPSFSELNRATQKIQAAYRGYYVRKSMLKRLQPKPKKQGPRVELSGPPVDTAASREIDLGRVIDIKSQVREDDVNGMFDQHRGETLGLKYDPMKTITHVTDEYPKTELESFLPDESRPSRMMPVKKDFTRSELDAMTPEERRQSRVKSGIRGPTFSTSVMDAEDEGRKTFAQMEESEEGPRMVPSQARSAPSQIGAASRVDAVPPSQVKSLPSQLGTASTIEGVPSQVKSATSQAASTIEAIPSKDKSAASQLGAASEAAELETTSAIEVVPSQAKSTTSNVKSAMSAAEMSTGEPQGSILDEPTVVSEHEVPMEVIEVLPAPEVPEDIPDDRSEVDSAPAVSVSSSAAVSGPTTDDEAPEVPSADEAEE